VVLNRLDYAGLLVIGHRGRGILKALTLGSTADWLLHRPPAPLAIIRSARPTRRVLLCVDGSPDAGEATRVLAGMPWISGVTVVVLSVDDRRIRPHSAIEEAQAVLLAAGADPEPRIRESLRHSVSFNVRSSVLELLEREPVDLVALGARGLGLGHHVLRGSTAAAVAHHARCSVLVARADEAAGESR
jgi:nucleotide-binding universal stress UspA family protein